MSHNVNQFEEAKRRVPYYLLDKTTKKKILRYEIIRKESVILAYQQQIRAGV